MKRPAIFTGTAQPHSDHKEWKPWSLKWPGLICLLVVEIGIIATLVALSAVSARDDGFTKVTVYSFGTFLTIPLDSSLQWTALPPFLISLFALAYGDMVTAAADRQPYVELNQYAERARNAKVTIMLEYASYPSFFNWVVAWRNKHFHLGGAMFTQFMATLVLVPLTANVFRSKLTELHRTIELTLPNRLDVSQLSLTTDLQPAFDISSAVLTYGAAAPVWTKPNNSVEAFLPRDASVAGDVNLPTFASSVDPDCRMIAQTDWNISYAGTSAQGFGSVDISFVDRGCEVSSPESSIGPSNNVYSNTWWQSCSGSEDPQDRVGVFAGIYSPDAEYHLSNITVISCWPKYWKTSVDVTMAFGSGGATGLRSIQRHNSSRIVSGTLRQLHANLKEYTVSGVSRDLQADSFGSVVHAYAQKLSPGTDVDNETYLNATSIAYGMVWATLASTKLMAPLQPAGQHNGMLTETTTKLYVVLPVAYALLVLLALMTLSTFIILVHVQRTASILQEEPQGLLGRAILLLGSEVMEFAKELRDRHPREPKLLEYIKQHHTIKTSRCWFEWAVGGKTGKIRLGGLDEGLSLNPGKWKRWVRRLTAPFKKSVPVVAAPATISQTKGGVGTEAGLEGPRPAKTM